MKYVEFDKKNLIPTNKIVAVIIDVKDPKQVMLWLVGGFTYVIHSVSEEEAQNVYNTIKESINEVLL